MTLPIAPMVIRGEVITDNLIEVGGRGGDLSFLTPDAAQYLDRLPVGNPTKLADMYTLCVDDILDYIEELGERLDLRTNPYLREACELSYLTSPMTPSIMRAKYVQMKTKFNRVAAREILDELVGIDVVDGWVRKTVSDGRDVEIRCFGSRALHIVAGNSPTVSQNTILQNLLLRGDAVIKAPSNDPFTALAIVRTMVDMAPDHPLTQHASVAYWRGGDEALEAQLYQPHNFEKIMAWGGYASMKHVTRYIQPGLELISMDPKRSASILGPEAFENETNMQDAALRVAADVASVNQVGCVNARVVYAMCGTDQDGVDKLNRFGEQVYAAYDQLPTSMSTKPKAFDPELKQHVETLRLDDLWYRVIGGQDNEGAVVVSQLSDPVSFADILNDRVCNLVPVDTLDEVLRAVDAYTQTVGIYPESLAEKLKDILPLHGAQRIVSLGYAVNTTNPTPKDAIEPMRRLGKWIVREVCSTDTVTPVWQWPEVPELEDLTADTVAPASIINYQ